MARIKCPSCGTLQDVEDSLRGKVCACSACGRGLRIAAAATGQPELNTAIRPERPGAEPRPLALPDFAAEVLPAEKPLVRRKKKRRRKRRAEAQNAVGYYLGAVGAFGWVLVGLFALWLAGLALALVLPDMGQVLLLLGNGLLLVGNVWIAFVAYRDSPVFGMLCFGTCLFTYVYVFMNLEETWRPAALTGLGLLFTLSGFVASHLSGVPVPAP